MVKPSKNPNVWRVLNDGNIVRLTEEEVEEYMHSDSTFLNDEDANEKLLQEM